LPNKYTKKELKMLTQWYQKEALEIFFDRIRVYSEITGWKCNKLQLSNAKKQWGVCDNNNNIKLNWRLIMAPLTIIDYVVIHELAHTVEPNHSKRFWEKVAGIMPDYKIKRQWLKDNSKYLNIE
jgi:predicted metal-dependent hydrolase